MMDAFPIRAQPTGLVLVVLNMTGAGAAAPTATMGPKGQPPTSADNAGFTTARAGVGSYSVTLPEKPGKLVAHWASHEHTTPSTTSRRFVNIDPDSMDSGNVLSFITVTPATDAAAAAAYELTTSDRITLFLLFKQTGTGV